MFSILAVSSVWTSGNDLQTRNKYIWTGTGNEFSYLNWLTHAPLQDESCRCVAFVSGLHKDCPEEQTSCAGWTVEPCSEHRQVLCEIKKTCKSE